MSSVSIVVANYNVDLQQMMRGIKAYRQRFRLDWDLFIHDETNLRYADPATWWIAPFVLNAQMIPAGVGHRPITTLITGNDPGMRQCVQFDNAAFGSAAAQHLYDAGYREAAVSNSKMRPRIKERVKGFRMTAMELGMRYHLLQPGGLDSAGIDQALIKQIRSLPAPLGMYAFIDSQAEWLREQLLRGGLRIPDEVALIGTGNMQRECEAREPELTSVAFPWWQLGHVAAKHIHLLMSGQSAPEQPVLKPSQVVVRASSGEVAPSDPVVQQAMDWLRQHLSAARPLAAAARACGVSAPTLVRRFRADIDTTPRDAFERFRLQRARNLLSNTELSIAEVANVSGFASATALGVCFRRRYDCTPSAWRKQTENIQQSCC